MLRASQPDDGEIKMFCLLSISGWNAESHSVRNTDRILITSPLNAQGRKHVALHGNEMP
jgi:hypothetical protein